MVYENSEDYHSKQWDYVFSREVSNQPLLFQFSFQEKSNQQQNSNSNSKNYNNSTSSSYSSSLYDDFDINYVHLNDMCILEKPTRFDQLKNSVGTGRTGVKGIRKPSSKDFSDESTVIELSHIESDVKAVVFYVTGSSGSSFEKFDSITLNVVYHDTVIASHIFECNGDHNALLLFEIHRTINKNIWKIQSINHKITNNNTTGSQFKDIQSIMYRKIEYLIPEKKLEWKPSADPFTMMKGDIVELKEHSPITIEMKWNLKVETKIDTLCMLYDYEGKNVENIYHGHRANDNGSVILKKEENKDLLALVLHEMSPKVNVILLCLTVEKEPSTCIESLNCTAINPRDNKSICTFTCNRISDKKSCVMFAISRKSVTQRNHWRVWALGDGMDGKLIEELEPIGRRYADIWNPIDIEKEKNKHQNGTGTVSGQVHTTTNQNWRDIDITVINATKLLHKNCDPYIKVDIPTNRPIRTAIVKNQNNPEFNFNFKIDPTPRLDFEAWHDDKFKDMLIGSASVNVKYLPMGENHLILDLKSKKGEVMGELNVLLVKI